MSTTMRSRGALLAITAALALAIAAAASVAIAQETGDVFYGCEKNGKLVPGTLQVGEEPICRGGATLVTWNQEGQPGPESIVVTPARRTFTVQPGHIMGVGVDCPSGQVPTGGAVSGNPSMNISVMDSSFKVSNGNLIGWQSIVQVSDESWGPVDVTWEVICTPGTTATS